MGGSDGKRAAITRSISRVQRQLKLPTRRQQESGSFEQADLLRLTDQEKKTLMTAVEEKKKKGEAALDSFLSGDGGDYYGTKYKGWKRCPICSGAAEAPMGVKKE